MKSSQVCVRGHTVGTLSITALVGCAGLPKAPAMPSDDRHFSNAVAVVRAGLEADPPVSMQLFPGDVVTVRVLAAETTDYAGLVVDERGVLHAPLAGDVEVGGLALTEAEGKVEAALRRFDRVARVSIVITDAAGHRVSVLGAVTTPGRLPAPPGTRVADLIALAGGTLRSVENGESEEMADLDGARLVRDGRAVPISVPLALTGHPKHNIRVRAGDQLYVPPSRGTRISVLGEVGAPKAIAYRSGMRLSEALAIAGGVTIDGDHADIRIIRGSLRAPKVYVADYKDIVAGDAHEVALAPGDVVFVTDHWIASVGEVLDRLSPIFTLGFIGVTIASITN